MGTLIDDYTWPAADLGPAIGQLAHRSGLSARSISLPPPSEATVRAGTVTLGPWIGVVAHTIDLEADEEMLDYAGAARTLATLEVGLVECPGLRSARYLAVLGADTARIQLLSPGSRVQWAPVDDVVGMLRREHDRSHGAEVDRLLARAGIAGRAASRARTALLRERAGAATIGRCWTFREPAGASFLRQLRDTGTTRRLLSLLVAHRPGCIEQRLDLTPQVRIVPTGLVEERGTGRLLQLECLVEQAVDTMEALLGCHREPRAP